MIPSLLILKFQELVYFSKIQTELESLSMCNKIRVTRNSCELMQQMPKCL